MLYNIQYSKQNTFPIQKSFSIYKLILGLDHQSLSLLWIAITSQKAKKKEMINNIFFMCV